jgi:hypothetical protein
MGKIRDDQKAAEQFAGALAGRLKDGARERDSLQKRTTERKAPNKNTLARRLIVAERGGPLTSPAQATGKLEQALRKTPGKKQASHTQGSGGRRVSAQTKPTKRSSVIADDGDDSDD